MKQYKYFATNIMYHNNKIRDYGYKGYHNQFRIVCKAISMAEANKIAKSLGLSDKSFNRGYTTETGNVIELELADKFGFIICTDGTLGKNYIDFKLLCL